MIFIKKDGSTYFDYPYLNLSPTNNSWNKVYVNIGTLLTQFGEGYYYRPYISADWDGTSSFNKLYIDNLKLLQFE